MLRWRKLIIKHNVIEITTSSNKKYTGKLAGSFYDLGDKNHCEKAYELFPEDDRKSLLRDFPYLCGGAFPECYNPKQFVIDYFNKYHTIGAKLLNLTDEY